MGNVEIRAHGDANSQVTDGVKERLAEWFERHGVTEASAFLYHHYNDGRYVAVSYRDTHVEDVESLSDACDELFEYYRNQRVHERCVWVHREWIERHLY